MSRHILLRLTLHFPASGIHICLLQLLAPALPDTVESHDGGYDEDHDDPHEDDNDDEDC